MEKEEKKKQGTLGVLRLWGLCGLQYFGLGISLCANSPSNKSGGYAQGSYRIVRDSHSWDPGGNFGFRGLGFNVRVLGFRDSAKSAASLVEDIQ